MKMNKQESGDVGIVICLLLLVGGAIITLLTGIPFFFTIVFILALVLWREVYYYFHKWKGVILLPLIVVGSLIIDLIVGINFTFILAFLALILFLWILLNIIREGG